MNSGEQLSQLTEQAKQNLRNGQYSAAKSAAQQALAIDPAYAPANFLLGVAQRLSGEHKVAINTLQRFIQLAPDVPPGHMELGLSQLESGQLANAENSLLQATQLSPQLSQAWQALAQIYAIQGREDDVARALASDLMHRDIDPAIKKASELFTQGKVGVAEGICREYLRHKPADVNAIHLLGDIGYKLRMIDEAGQLYLRCLELAPNHLNVKRMYAQVLARQNKYDQALAIAEELLQRDPHNPSFMVLRASTLAQAGRYEAAHEQYREALQRIPEAAPIWTSYGHSLRYGGLGAEAVEAYRKAIAIEPSNGEAWWSLANLKTVKFTADDIEEMQRHLDAIDEDTPDKIHLGFALGKALEDQQRFDESYTAYTLGNGIKQKYGGYSAEDTTERTDNIINTCNKAFFENVSEGGCPDPSPIFVVGLPRSGSTLIEQILASHSKVEATDELHFITRMATRLEGKRKKDEPRKYPGIVASLSAAERTALGEEYLAAASIYRSGSERFIDKLPNNFVHIGLIKAILPNATIIDARRSPMASGFANLKQLFAEGQPFTYSQSDIANYYADYIRLMNHWQDVLPGSALTVEYEHVVADLETQVRRLLDHCGLPFEDSCLNFHRTQRSVRTASSEQVRQPIFKDALEQWRNYEPHLSQLKQTLQDRGIL